MCEEMKKFREYLDQNNIDWVDMSSVYEDMKDFSITRTHFIYKNKKVSVINGMGTYGGIDVFGIKNHGLLEVMIGGNDPVGWLTCEEAIKLTFN